MSTRNFFRKAAKYTTSLQLFVQRGAQHNGGGTAELCEEPFYRVSAEHSRKTTSGRKCGTFEDLMGQENEDLVKEKKGFLTNENTVFPASKDSPVISKEGTANEPWIAFTTEDRLGLALSGGGIRSATFNLGVLQALDGKHLLQKVDYLSTVSGGGYIGGFWTRYRQAQASGNDIFPKSAKVGSGPRETREAAEVRHLREFSRFLIPRKGLTSEFWSAAITILTGLVPSLIAALATVCLVMALWAFIAVLMLPSASGSIPPRWTIWLWLDPVAIVFVVGATLWLVLIARRGVPDKLCKIFTPYYFVWIAVAVWGFLVGWDVFLQSVASASAKGVSLGLDSTPQPPRFQLNLYLLRPCIALAGSLCALTLLRLMMFSWEGRRRWILGEDISRLVKSRQPGTLETEHLHAATAHEHEIAQAASLERIMGLLLAIQLLWASLAGVWEFARWLSVEAKSHQVPNVPVGSVGGLTAVLAFVFYRVQSWVTKPDKESSRAKILQWLRPWAPQLLANGIVLLLFVFVAVVLLHYGMWDQKMPHWGVLAGSFGILLFTLVFFNPMSLGLHEFYRARLSRCYLGAAQPNLKNSRLSMECPEDDMRLADDRGKPIHLICCAANQLYGDPLSTLHRGARSAVLSRHGVAIGNCWMKHSSALRLSSAMTASAAAFNSLMGELNLILGRAVAFVMTALNLRLGMWVPNPAYTNDRPSRWSNMFAWVRDKMPGRFFMREMLGWAQCRADAQPTSRDVHLSDGGHFENLALYELIRRHCRYIIVSDAGEDHAFSFADLGRAVRRVREDFGVEIETDLSLIRPGPNNLSKEHIAVGVIHYDGVGGTDKGTILYFKPTLTGDEPPDVQQYHARNPRFPHESTGDQFFDEAQWESYRRLGEHTANASLRTLEEEQIPLNRLFYKLRSDLQHVPWLDNEAGVRLYEHAAGLEAALDAYPSPALRHEFVGAIVGIEGLFLPGAHDGNSQVDADQTTRDVLLAIRAFKLIEEAWYVCDLDDYWSHPRATSWMACLQRWAAMPTLRKWWPVLKALFGDGFQHFADEHLHLPTPVSDGNRANPSVDRVELKLTEHHTHLPSGFALQRSRLCRPPFEKRWRDCFSLDLMVQPQFSDAPLSVQVGLAVIDVKNSYAEWNVDDLFVPPELHGAGFTTKLLDKLIEHFKSTKLKEFCLKVKLDSVLDGRNQIEGEDNNGSARATSKCERHDPGWRQDRVNLIDFYRSRGFQFDNGNWERGLNTVMVLEIEDPFEAGL